MAQYYDKLTFSDYPPTELLGSGIYNDSIKRLLFQYRTRNEEKLIVYIALSQDKPNIEIPNVENQMNGCRILGAINCLYRKLSSMTLSSDRFDIIRCIT